MSTDRMMPIRRSGFSLSFDVLDETLAQRQHGQSLARLAERGGMSPVEALALVSAKHWYRYPETWAIDALRPLTRPIVPSAAALGEQHDQ